MRHRRHTLISARLRKLPAPAAVPCVTALLVAALTGAAPGPDTRTAAEPGDTAVVREYGGTAAKSPARRGTSPAHSAQPSPPPAEGGYPDDGNDDGADDGAGVFRTQDLYEPAPGSLEDGSATFSDHPPTTAATGEVSPVLPLGAGMTLIGLGLALLALRLRRA